MPGDHAADEQPRQVGRQRHQHIVEPEAEAREQYHRPAPVAVRQRAEHRQKRNCISAQAVPKTPKISAARAVSPPQKRSTSFGSTGMMMPEREHVEQDDDEDEGERGVPEAHAELLVLVGQRASLDTKTRGHEGKTLTIRRMTAFDCGRAGNTRQIPRTAWLPSCSSCLRVEAVHFSALKRIRFGFAPSSPSRRTLSASYS